MLVNGRITGTRNASHELAIENLCAQANFTEEKVDASLSMRGAFIGITQDLNESTFFHDLHAAVLCIGRSHRWLVGSHEKPSASLCNTPPKTIEEKAIHVVVSLAASSAQRESVRLAIISPAITIPALVQSIGSLKLDVSFPPPGSESFDLVFETNDVHLDAISPYFNAEEGEFILEKHEGFCNSLPLFGVFKEVSACSKLLRIAQFSAWVRFNDFLEFVSWRFLKLRYDFALPLTHDVFFEVN